MKEYYSRLLIKDGASIEEVKKAHRKLVKKFHPDNNSGSNDFTEEFKLIQEAYEKLNDYLSQNNKNQSTNSYNYNKDKSSNLSSEGIVKSEAKFAEESDAKLAETGDNKFNESVLNLLIRTLIFLFIICCFFAVNAQESLIIKSILFLFLTSFVVIISYNIFKNNSINSK